MKNKKIIFPLLLLLGLIVLLLIIFLIIRQLNLSKINQEVNSKPAATFQADFLKPEEKKSLGIPAEFKAQAIKRNSQGGVMVYKIIRNDNEVVDPADIGPISPRTQK